MIGLLNACIGAFMCMLYFNTMGYILKVDMLMAKTNDADMITVDKFTVTGKIKKEDYFAFDTSELSTSKPKIEHFKDHLTQLID